MPDNLVIDRSLDLDVVIDRGPHQPTVIPTIQGPQGPAGAAGLPGGSYHVHTQTTPAATWQIVHNLNRYPSIRLFIDSVDGLVPVLTDIEYSNLNTIIVEWPAPESGVAEIG